MDSTIISILRNLQITPKEAAVQIEAYARQQRITKMNELREQMLEAEPEVEINP